MKAILKLYFVFLMGVMTIPANSQEKLFSLDDCINYALENSTTIGRAQNEVVSQTSELEQRKAERGPNLSLSASESWSSSNSYNSTNTNWDREDNTATNVALSSNLTLYNGAKIRNSIIQGKINLSAAETDIKTEQELLSLDVLSDYISILQAKEQVKNYESQLEASAKQLEEATIKKDAGVLSPADYFNIRSQYASDKASLVQAKSDLRISLVSLMQTMNMPVSNSFDIVEPDSDTLLKLNEEYEPSTVYNVALGLQPSVKTAEYDLQSSEIDIQLAKVNAMPSLSLSGSLQSAYSNSLSVNFSEQLANRITPTLGLSLSIPIYQRKEVKNQVKQAVISRDNIQYNLIDIKNDLRKSIEQACTDGQTANSAYLSYKEQYEAEQESYKLAQEMFSQGLLSSVDFITSKNNLSAAENNLTKAKYNLILQNEIVEYYMGNPIGF